MPQQVHALALWNPCGAGGRPPNVAKQLPSDRFTVEGEHEAVTSEWERRDMLGERIDNDLGQWDGAIAGPGFGRPEPCARPAVGDELPVNVQFPVKREGEDGLCDGFVEAVFCCPALGVCSPKVP